MKITNKKIIFIILLACIVIPLLIYVGTSVYIGAQVYNLIDSSFEHHGENYMEYADIISEENYVFLDYSRGFNDDWSEKYHTFPVVLHNFKKAKAYYRYTIAGDIHGGYRIPVTISLELKNGKWYVTDVGEPY